MNDYTAEDFKNARFAEHRHGAKAVRWEVNYRIPWHTAIGDRFSDEQMAEHGWRPVREADTIYESQADRIRRQNEEIERLRNQRAPLTLDTLREAWEQAEVPTEDTPIREGDVVIDRHGGGFTVEPADRILSGQTHGRERVLHRVPQPEPWQALADEMEELYDGYSLRAAEAAQFLHERGVRVTGGDDDEQVGREGVRAR